MSLESVAVTGGNGRLGSAVLADLAERGYRTVNLDRDAPAADSRAEFVRTDLLDAGEVYGALAMADPDAVVHTGTINQPTHHPGHQVYRSNVQTSYHVLEAATGLDIDRVCLASSINAMGASYQAEPIEISYLPVDESHPLTPRDPYGVAKRALEVTADGFGRRPDGPTTISSIRYPWIAREDELVERFRAADRSLEALADADAFQAEEVLFSYIHVEDAAAVTRRAVEADFAGHEPFWVAAADTSAEAETGRLVDRFFPDVEVQADLSGHQGLVDVGKAERLLDWRPAHTWRDG